MFMDDGIMAPVQYALTLWFAAAICLILEVMGSPAGFRKLGSRPHIAIVAAIAVIWAQIQITIKMRYHATSLPLDGYAYTSSFILSAMALLAIALGYWQMRETEQDRGEIYAMVLAALPAMWMLTVTDDMLWVIVCASFWFVVQSFMVLLRGKRDISSEVAGKLLFGTMAWFLVSALAVVFMLLAVESTHFSALPAAIANQSVLSRIALALVLVSVLFLLGVTPLLGIHVDYFDGAPASAAMLFGAGVYVGTSVLWIRLLEAFHAEQGSLLTFFYKLCLWLGFISLCVPLLRAYDQQRIGRLCVYLIVSQTGLVLYSSLFWGFPALLSSYWRMEVLHIAVVLPGILVGYNFWKTKLRADKTWEDYAGAGRKHPWVALCWIVLMGSLVGVPGTLGFSMRYLLIQQAMKQEKWDVVLGIAIGIVLGAAVVMRLFVFLFAKKTNYELEHYHQPRQTALIFVLTACLCVVSLFPDAMLQVLRLNG